VDVYVCVYTCVRRGKTRYSTPDGVRTFILIYIYINHMTGICCSEGDGNYTLKVDGIVIKTGGNFTNIETTLFDVSCKKVTVEIQTDQQPQDTSWNITGGAASNGTIVVMSGENYTSSGLTFTSSRCLEYGTYNFTIYDSQGDGMQIECACNACV
jgi:hypothetical protein